MRYIYESTAVVFDSKDAGQTWTTDTLPRAFDQSSELSGVTCVRPTDCVAVGGLGVVAGPDPGQSSGTTIGAVLITHDGGAKWITGNVPPSVQGLSAISCPTATLCMAVGYHSSEQSTVHTPAVLVTHDGGDTWTVEW
jgi:photosystem II stability/assembly factor-like uncharacterized protein